MNQDDTTESIKETFNVSLENREILPSKNNSKVKLTIAIISTVLILAAATTLLIGYLNSIGLKMKYIKSVQILQEK